MSTRRIVRVQLPKGAVATLRQCEQWAAEDNWPPAVTVLRCLSGRWFTGTREDAATVAGQALYWADMAVLRVSSALEHAAHRFWSDVRLQARAPELPDKLGAWPTSLRQPSQSSTRPKLPWRTS